MPLQTEIAYRIDKSDMPKFSNPELVSTAIQHSIENSRMQGWNETGIILLTEGVTFMLGQVAAENTPIKTANTLLERDKRFSSQPQKRNPEGEVSMRIRNAISETMGKPAASTGQVLSKIFTSSLEILKEDRLPRLAAGYPKTDQRSIPLTGSYNYRAKSIGRSNSGRF